LKLKSWNVKKLKNNGKDMKIYRFVHFRCFPAGKSILTPYPSTSGSFNPLSPKKGNSIQIRANMAVQAEQACKSWLTPFLFNILKIK